MEERIDCYRKTGKTLSYISQAMSLKMVRQNDPYGYGSSPANLQRGTLKRLDEAFKGFFRRVKTNSAKAGFPRFKGKSWFNSFSFAEFSGIRFDGRRLRWKGMPGGLRVHMHRPIPDVVPLGAIFKRDDKGWSVSFAVRVPCAERRIVSNAVGIDVGIQSLCHLSDGTIIPNLRPARRAEREMRRRQRQLARCKRGSNRRKAIRARVAAWHRKIADTRRTGLHQVSAMLVKKYDLIAIEALNIRGLAAGILARDINDAAWATLFSMVRYKAQKTGAHLVEVDPKFTSQDCSGCGERVPKSLAQRTHSCPHCGLVMDRDENAARNVLHKAVLGLGTDNVIQWDERRAGNIKIGGVQK